MSINFINCIFDKYIVTKFENPWDTSVNKGNKQPNPKEKSNSKTPQVPQLEDIFNDIKNKILKVFGGDKNTGFNGSNNGDKNKNSNQNNKQNQFDIPSRIGVFGILAVSLILWLSTGFYTLDINEQGVVTRFGKFNRVANRGLNYKLPNPIENVEKINVTRINKENIGLKFQKDLNVQNNNTVWVSKFKKNTNNNGGINNYNGANNYNAVSNSQAQSKDQLQRTSASNTSNSSQNSIDSIDRGVGSANSMNNNTNNNTDASYDNRNDDINGNNIKLADRSDEDQMLTGDENMIDMQFYVQWYIQDAELYVMNIKDEIGYNTVRVVAESVMRDVVGTVRLYDALSERRESIETQVKQILQKTLDEYKSGIKIKSTGILYSYVAPEVMDAYRDVQSAKADKEREINQAYAYRNDIIPRARGEAQAIIENATAYRDSNISKAKGDAQRYQSILKEYKLSKEIVKKRIYIETLESILSDMDKVIIDSKQIGNSISGAGGVLPILNLNDRFNGGKKMTNNTKTTINNNIDN